MGLPGGLLRVKVKGGESCCLCDCQQSDQCLTWCVHCSSGSGADGSDAEASGKRMGIEDVNRLCKSGEKRARASPSLGCSSDAGSDSDSGSADSPAQVTPASKSARREQAKKQAQKKPANK